MEKQASISDQKYQPIDQNLVSKSAPILEKTKFSYWLISAGALILLIAGFIGGYIFKLKFENMFFPQQISDDSANTKLVDKPSTNDTEMSDVPSDWKAYFLKTVALEFKLPPLFINYGEMTEEIRPGEKGTLLCMTFPKKSSFFLVKTVLAGSSFCNINYFGLGTVSPDFEEGRGGGFTDLLGFTVENGKYLARQNLDRKFEIPLDLVKEVRSRYGVQVLKIKGKNSVDGEWRGPVGGTPGDGKIGALINTTNTLYPGLAIEMELNENLTEELFDKILSTLRFNY